METLCEHVAELGTRPTMHGTSRPHSVDVMLRPRPGHCAKLWKHSHPSMPAKVRKPSKHCGGRMRSGWAGFGSPGAVLQMKRALVFGVSVSAMRFGHCRWSMPSLSPMLSQFSAERHAVFVVLQVPDKADA